MNKVQLIEFITSLINSNRVIRNQDFDGKPEYAGKFATVSSFLYIGEKEFEIFKKAGLISQLPGKSISRHYDLHLANIFGFQSVKLSVIHTHSDSFLYMGDFSSPIDTSTVSPNDHFIRQANLEISMILDSVNKKNRELQKLNPHQELNDDTHIRLPIKPSWGKESFSYPYHEILANLQKLEEEMQAISIAHRLDALI